MLISRESRQRVFAAHGRRAAASRLATSSGILEPPAPMNLFYAAASATVFALGLTHSLIGEWLIFQRLRRDDPARPIVPTRGGEPLRERHLRILWANWHVTTALGWAVAGVLLMLARAPDFAGSREIAWALAAGMAASGGLVLSGTRGRHPGWIGLMLAAVLTVLGANAG